MTWSGEKRGLSTCPAAGLARQNPGFSRGWGHL